MCNSALCVIEHEGVVLELLALGHLVGAQLYVRFAIRVVHNVGIRDRFLPACVQRQSFRAEQRAVKIPLVTLQALSGLVPAGKDVAGAGQLIAGDLGRIQNVGIGIVGKMDLRIHLRGLGLQSTSAQFKGYDVFSIQVLPFATAP